MFQKNYKQKKFQGNPVKIVPLTNSIDPNKTEKEKKALKIFFGLNKKKREVIIPKNKPNKAGIKIKDIGIKYV